jgi:glycosyltransferase involved in cell wall biosynthesis
MIHKTPLVSISVVTYNHHSYIKQCLDGILMQQTNFPFEIILGEDESTDGTREICIEYANKYPDKINLFLRSRKDVIYINGNPTGRYNFIENLKVSKSKYIALCEGDDYWTDPLKLQKQVDFLEGNEEYGICFHESEVLWEGENKISFIKLNSDFNWNNMTPSKSVYTISDVLKGPFMATASVVLRRNDLIDFPNWFYKAVSGDITLYALILKNNKIKFISEVMCVYRKHPGGITRVHSSNFIILNRIEMLKNINTYYDNVYFLEIEQATSAYLHDIKYLNIKEMFQLLKLYLCSNIVKRHHIMLFTKKNIRKLINLISSSYFFYTRTVLKKFKN